MKKENKIIITKTIENIPLSFEIIESVAKFRNSDWYFSIINFY